MKPPIVTILVLVVLNVVSTASAAELWQATDVRNLPKIFETKGRSNLGHARNDKLTIDEQPSANWLRYGKNGSIELEGGSNFISYQLTVQGFNGQAEHKTLDRKPATVENFKATGVTPTPISPVTILFISGLVGFLTVSRRRN